MPETVSAERSIRIATGRVMLDGDLVVPEGARGVVLFAHGSGSGRHSPRNRFVAQQLRAAGLGTLLIELLSEQEESVDQFTGQLRFVIDLIAERQVGASARHTVTQRTTWIWGRWTRCPACRSCGSRGTFRRAGARGDGLPLGAAR